MARSEPDVEQRIFGGRWTVAERSPKPAWVHTGSAEPPCVEPQGKNAWPRYLGIDRGLEIHPAMRDEILYVSGDAGFVTFTPFSTT